MNDKYEKTLDTEAKIVTKYIDKIPVVIHLINVPCINKDDEPVIICHAGVVGETHVEAFVSVSFLTASFDEALEKAIKFMEKEIAYSKSKRDNLSKTIDTLMAKFKMPLDKSQLN